MIRHMIRRRTLFALGAFLALAATGPAPAAQAEERLNVVASFSILADMVREVGGDDVTVTMLVGPDGDAHVYEPTPGDAKALTQADVVIVNGLAFEGWLERLIEASGTKAAIIVASDGVTPLAIAEEDHKDTHAETHGPGHGGHGHGHDGHNHGDFDPHAWQSLQNGMIYVENITRALVAADPANADGYKARAQAYLTRLAALDTRLKAEFAALPAERRRLVTSHDAFGYFAAAYGLTVVAPQGVSTEAEASAADVARLIDLIRAEGIMAVFVENVTNPALIEQIARESGAKVGGTLYTDALSTAEGPASTYERMFEHNAAQILGALTGS